MQLEEYLTASIPEIEISCICQWAQSYGPSISLTSQSEECWRFVASEKSKGETEYRLHDPKSSVHMEVFERRELQSDFIKCKIRAFTICLLLEK